MKAEIHSLNWPGSDPRLADEQKGVFSHFKLPLTQHHRKLDHGFWMDAVLKQSSADVVLFVDNDCVPLSRSAPIEAIRWAAQHRSFLGLAQASNHINNGVHVFAAPAFLAIARSAWMQLGQPSCRPTPRGDAAEELSWRAEEEGLPYKAWYPTHFHHPSREGLWRMGNYGTNGIGSVFAERVFHLYQGRFADNVDLFVRVCSSIRNGSFSTEGYRSCIS
ncbi:MAG: hypothetical protein VX934_05895 [Cyanobacteriota bacterium]|nr:hypothetical protein [Cyanobacteriota bacterium]